MFPPGAPVEIADPYMIGKARNNPFFRLDEGVPRPQGTVYGIMPETWTNTPDDPPKRKRGRPPKVRQNGE